jgi:hypothetical protein
VCCPSDPHFRNILAIDLIEQGIARTRCVVPVCAPTSIGRVLRKRAKRNCDTEEMDQRTLNPEILHTVSTDSVGCEFVHFHFCLEDNSDASRRTTLCSLSWSRYEPRLAERIRRCALIFPTRLAVPKPTKRSFHWPWQKSELLSSDHI